LVLGARISGKVATVMKLGERRRRKRKSWRKQVVSLA
jgi:hypothetical protein